jgi:hypothetical protein
MQSRIALELRDAFNSPSLICLNFKGASLRTALKEIFLVACTLPEVAAAYSTFFIYDKNNDFPIG